MKEKEGSRRDVARGGFTLIEIMLVVVIIGVLMGIAVASFSGRSEQARINAARASIGAISTAVDMYEVDTGRLPPSLNSLVQSDGAVNWRGPYIKGGAVPVDPWGNVFRYEQSGDGYKVSSGGPGDGSAAITSW